MILEWLRRLFRVGAPVGAGGPGDVVVVEGLVTWRPASGGSVTIHLNDLVSVDILTTSMGPWADDLYYVLSDAARTIAIPVSATGSGELLESLQTLAGFDNETVIVAMGATGDGRFPVWRRTDQAA